MYEKMEPLLDSGTKGKDYTILMGDFNAIVGEGKDGECVGYYGLGTLNARGEKLVDFCNRRRMHISYTWFTQDRRRRYIRGQNLGTQEDSRLILL